MKEKQFGYQVKRLLDQKTTNDEVLERLKAARHLALEKRQVERVYWAPSWVTAMAGGLIGPSGASSVFWRIVLPLMVLTLGVFVVNHWYELQLIQELVDIDADVLTGDLPIEAYLDKGFDAWLKRSSD